ncbi:hypothetical protein E2C01_026838 [Portunus trituberculatus]|uniref:Uncharacterized protein n=1 Tax=Portunus trituberculatus TaxID=210409 RepID=A0A5B7EM37_PORTR|nr:hypothetical protein [Portunus trituberculatus]
MLRGTPWIPALLLDTLLSVLSVVGEASGGFTLEQGIPHFNTKPYFLPPPARNVTALEGQSAYLHCRVAQLGDKKERRGGRGRLGEAWARREWAGRGGMVEAWAGRGLGWKRRNGRGRVRDVWVGRGRVEDDGLGEAWWESIEDTFHCQCLVHGAQRALSHGELFSMTEDGDASHEVCPPHPLEDTFHCQCLVHGAQRALTHGELFSMTEDGDASAPVQARGPRRSNIFTLTQTHHELTHHTPFFKHQHVVCPPHPLEDTSHCQCVLVHGAQRALTHGELFSSIGYSCAIAMRRFATEIR